MTHAVGLLRWPLAIIQIGLVFACSRLWYARTCPPTGRTSHTDLVGDTIRTVSWRQRLAREGLWALGCRLAVVMLYVTVAFNMYGGSTIGVLNAPALAWVVPSGSRPASSEPFSMTMVVEGLNGQSRG